MKKRVLIVEDDTLIASMFRVFLDELGYNLLGVVTNAQEVIKLCGELHPDIILMDIHLGDDLDGIEICEMLKSRFNIPIIFLSSDTEQETLQRVIKAQSYGYLVKPIDKHELGVAMELAYYKHQFDEEQKKRENSYRKFITDLPEAIVLVANDGNISYVNYLGLKLFNTVYIDDLLDQQFATFLNADEAANFNSWLTEAIKLQQSIEKKKLHFRNVHGKHVNIELIGTVVEFNGKPTVQLILRNIDEQIACKACLDEKNAIIECLPMGVVVFTPDGIVKSANEKAETILSEKNVKLVGATYNDLIVSEKQTTFVEDLLQPLNIKDSYKVMLNILGKNYFVLLSSIKNTNGEITAVLCCIEAV